MNPERGLINQMLGGADIGWLTNPNLAIFSIALVDVWKGVGLATVIFIAGLVSIPTEYYEAAAVDGAGRRQVFRNIILPLARPATATVITLSLIGGLRSFELIWLMTKGGPGFASDVIASVIYKKYRGRLQRPVHGGQRRVVPGRHSDRRAADQVAQSRRRILMESTRKRNTSGLVIGIAAIVISAIFFVVPFVFILLIASKPVAEANLLEFSWPSNFVLFDNLAQAFAARVLPDGHRLHQQRDPHCGERRRHGHLQRHGRLRLAAPSQSAGPGDQHADPGRPDRAARNRAHHLGPAGPGSLQDHAGSDIDRDRLWPSLLHIAVPRLHVDGVTAAG